MYYLCIVQYPNTVQIKKIYSIGVFVILVLIIVALNLSKLLADLGAIIKHIGGWFTWIFPAPFYGLGILFSAIIAIITDMSITNTQYVPTASH